MMTCPSGQQHIFTTPSLLGTFVSGEQSSLLFFMIYNLVTLCFEISASLFCLYLLAPQLLNNMPMDRISRDKLNNIKGRFVGRIIVKL